MHVRRRPRPHPVRHRLWLCALLVLAWPLASLAADDAEVEALLRSAEPPFGVVFEIVEHDRNALDWALPRIQEYAHRLRRRFPDLGLAVVSHGREEFALLRARQGDKAALHQTVQSLVEADVPVVVCGTHASWFDKRPEDFPDYVEVAPAGPTAIRNYEAMGYQLIVLEQP